MVVIFTKDSNTIEVKFEMFERPARIRASNFVRRWELLQLEEQTEHLFKELLAELQFLLKLELTPNGVTQLAAEYYDEKDATSVAMVFHHSNEKFKQLSLFKFLKQHSERLFPHTISLEFDILDRNSIKLSISIYVHHKLG